jgi:hypothetical protein
MTASRNRHLPPRKRHVGVPLFAAIMCRKFAMETTFSWHFSRYFSSHFIWIGAQICGSDIREIAALSRD